MDEREGTGLYYDALQELGGGEGGLSNAFIKRW